MDNNAEGDRGSMLVRCASQSSLDESSQRVAGGAAGACGGAGSGDGARGEGHAGALLGALAALRRDRALCDVLLCARADLVSPSPHTHLHTHAHADTDKTTSDTESEAQSSSDVTVDTSSGDAAPTQTAIEGGGGGAGSSTAAVAAHRAVLAACSPYFRAMFTQFDERTMHTITIQNVDPPALEAIVDYIYSPDSLLITEDNVQGLLSASSLLQVGGVRALCCTFLAGALAADNALGIRAFAELHACADLALCAQRYVERHFLDVVQHDEFLALDVPALCALLASDSLCTAGAGEEAVLDAALRWVRHDERERLPHLAPVLEQVRLPLLPHEVLVSRAQQPPLRSAAVAVKDLIIEALSFHLLRPSRRLAAAQALPRARPRHTPVKPKMLLVVGGQAPKAIRDVEAYDLETEQWTPCRDLLTRRCRAGLAMLDGRVYAVGGFNGTLRVRSVDVYCAARDAWSAGPALCARRSTLGVAVLDGLIYAVGGFDGATGLSSAEVLEPAAGVWRPIADMSSRRSSVGVAVLEGYVYAVGGYDGATRQCLASVERYDPRTDRWEPVEPMSARRSGCGVGVAGGALWALGGHDGPAVRRSIERYSPRGGWTAAPPMRSARRNAAVLSHQGRLYVVGGDDGATNLNTVEVFDPTTEQWTELPARMSVGRSYAGVVLVERAN